MATHPLVREKRLLQMAIFFAAFVPISAGILGMVNGTSFFLKNCPMHRLIAISVTFPDYYADWA